MGKRWVHDIAMSGRPVTGRLILIIGQSVTAEGCLDRSFYDDKTHHKHLLKKKEGKVR